MNDASRIIIVIARCSTNVMRLRLRLRIMNLNNNAPAYPNLHVVLKPVGYEITVEAEK
jgi:hypothetical protein